MQLLAVGPRVRALVVQPPNHNMFHLQSTRDHKLVVTGEDSCPLEVRNKERNTQYDLQTHQEEADIIIVQQVLLCVGEARQTAVASDDTDVLLLLLYH